MLFISELLIVKLLQKNYTLSFQLLKITYALFFPLKNNLIHVFRNGFFL